MPSLPVEVARPRSAARRRAETSVTSAPSAISTGAVSVDETAKQRGLDRARPSSVAVLLHAEVDRLAPLVVLVVVVAARVEAEVAAERAHVAQVRRRDQARRPRPMRGPARAQPRRRADQRRVSVARRAEACSAAVRAMPRAARRCRAGRPASLRRLLAALHVRAADRCRRRPASRPAPCAGEHRAPPRHRARRAVREARQPHHDARHRSSMASRVGSASASRPSLAPPSPPSHGGGTSSGSGQAIVGNVVGPKRAPCRPLRVERLQDLVRRDRHLVDAHADRVVDRVGHRRHHRQQRPLARPPSRRTGRCGSGSSTSYGDRPPACRASSGSCTRASTGTCARARATASAAGGGRPAPPSAPRRAPM